MREFIKLCGALASVGSLVMLIVIANHIARQLEEEYEYEEVEVDDDEEDDEGLVDIDKTDYPQE